jgi:hypothetical protein
MSSSHLKPLVSIEDQKLTPQEENRLTLEMYWELMFRGTPMPNNRIITSWLTFNSIERIMAGIDSASDYVRRRAISDPASVGKITSGIIRRLSESKVF